ncbi:hypothetical protein [Curtobacterium sp. MCBD17_023]|uniref:hypothetical protein n=1 Tax=Curtobacterium sp. MCBD17_023 TaxID=2175657 RepID=UPI000D96DEC4|nr:hypothetical protein [Curtobacterium sp. MCBD17_023]PYY48070.1 hypothetical protein DEI84_10295 [Curtobacterium sp. MCBD17_023]
MSRTAATVIAQEVHNPVIPFGYDIAWSICLVLVLLAISAAVWLLVRTATRATRRGSTQTGERTVRRPGR